MQDDAKYGKIISITGTKGKSTVSYVLADVLTRAHATTLRVDTTGYFVNGEQKGTLASSKKATRLVPTVCPGRYLTAMEGIDDFTAVLECSLGCSNAAGLGYKVHDIGIFTNVLEDHIGSTARLRTRADIAAAKRFIFSRIHPEGTAIFNADDDMVCAELMHVNPSVTLLPCGIDFRHFDLEKHLAEGGKAVTIQDGAVVVVSSQDTQTLVNINNVSWTFNGQYAPSLYNLMFVAATLYAYADNLQGVDIWRLLEESQLDPYGGRLVRLKTPNGVHVIADYAHEKYSLAALGDLAEHLKDSPDNKVIGVVRLAYDRTDELIADTAEYIANHYDEFVVYDKVDGYLRKPKKTIGSFKMVVGRISEIFANNLQKHNSNVTRILREDEAIAFAAQTAKPGDVVCIIVNDDIHQSMGFIRDSFSADFI